MQVSNFLNLISFKGSFKNINPDDYLPESDNNPSKKPVNYNVDLEYAPNSDVFIPTQEVIKKEFSCKHKGIETSVQSWESSPIALLNSLPDNIKNLLEFHHINPENELFMVGGINASKERFIVFNSFFTDDNGALSEQIHCLKSQDENLTPLQEEVVKIFNTPYYADYLRNKTHENPLKSISVSDKNINEIFVPALSALSYMCECENFDSFLNQNGSPRLVKYGLNDGKPNYLTIFLPVK